MTTRAPGQTLAQWMAQSHGGGKNSYVKDWKERGFVEFWLHRTAPILTVYRHGFVSVYVKEDRQTQVVTREIQFSPLVCFEDVDVVDSWRDKVTLLRDVPPRVCPICLMQEHLIQLVNSGHLDWRRPLFQFKGTDSRKDRVFHVGGFTGMFANKNLAKDNPAKFADLSGAESTDPAKRAVQIAGQDPFFPASKWLGPVYQSGDSPNSAFRQNVDAKKEYALTVVDNANVGAGASVMFAGKSMGDKVIAVIQKAIKEARAPGDPDGKRGDPQQYPYVIRVEYNEQAGKRNPNDYYDALKLGQIPMTAAVDALIRGPAPDLTKIAARPNLTKLRASIEEHCLIKRLPFDSYFDRAFKAEAEARFAAPTEVPAQMVPEVGRNPGSVQESQYGAFVLPNAAQSATPVPEELFGCEGCGAAMRASETVCVKCGYRYDVEAAPPPPPPPLRPRSSAGVAPIPAKAPPAPLPASPAQDPWGLAPGTQGGAIESPDAGGTAWPGDPSEDIPFIESFLNYGSSAVYCERWRGSRASRLARIVG